MPSITVPNTCPIIDAVLQKLDLVEDILLDCEREDDVHLLSDCVSMMEEIRSANSELRYEGMNACDSSDTFESQVEEWQQMCYENEKKIEELKQQLFDIENERKDEKWQKFLSTQEVLLIGSQ